jgi:hypothetical protein
MVLGAFLRAQQGFVAAGHHALHHVGMRAVGGRHLGRIEHAQAAGRACADVDQAPVAAEAVDHQVDRARDLQALLAHGGGDQAVLVVDQVDDLQRRQLVDAHAARVALLRQPRVERRPGGRRFRRRARVHGVGGNLHFRHENVPW